MSLTIGSLCTGYGGLDLAVESVLGASTVWVSDIDKGARTILARRFPNAPNLGDLTRLDWSDVPPVDVITAGYPCQPFSHAGKRTGTADDRHIWPHIATAVRTVRPRLVVLENVAGHLTLGLGDVLGDLASLRYDTQWGCLRASDIGAPHQRKRLFIVAYPADADRQFSDQWRQPASGEAQGWRAWADFSGSGGAPAADAAGPRLQGAASVESSGWIQPPRHGIDAAADAQGKRRHEGRPEPAGKQRRLDDAVSDAPAADAGSDGWGDYTAAIRRWEHLTRPAPAPTEPNTKGAPRLAPAFVEWMMGLPDGWVTECDISRVAQLKALGNGVVPQQAAAAISQLLGRADA